MADFECVIWKVEHGSAAFLRTPNDRTVMFDAGRSENFSPAQYLTQHYGLNSSTNKLDRLVLSHPDRDHIQDLPDIYSLMEPKRFTRNKSIPDKVIYPSGTTDLQEPLKTYKKMADRYNYELGEYNKDRPISNWGNILIETFWCEPIHIENCSDSKMKNNLSCVSYVQYFDTEIVFPGDLEPFGWHALLGNTGIKDFAGKSKCRILLASHHGRKSGIRYEVDDKEYIYDNFLTIMKPHLVIMSDKWGNETTDKEAYLPYCEGYPVYSGTDKKVESKKVLTTKTNDFVLIKVATNQTTPIVAVS
ncbi:MAG: ComEC/Rec2 family competence protein [Candidatus Sifarchaeia archaeon]|jgi:competence protein ComEC